MENLIYIFEIFFCSPHFSIIQDSHFLIFYPKHVISGLRTWYFNRKLRHTHDTSFPVRVIPEIRHSWVINEISKPKVMYVRYNVASSRKMLFLNRKWRITGESQVIRISGFQILSHDDLIDDRTTWTIDCCWNAIFFHNYFDVVLQFCGDVIAGISLLSDCVMRMTLVGNEQNCREDFFLPRRSLYIMRFEYRLHTRTHRHTKIHEKKNEI